MTRWSLLVTLSLVGTLAGAAAHPMQRSRAEARPTPYRCTVVRIYPHDPQAFTQGLVFRDGFLYESTGLYGQSSLRKVRLETGEVVQRRAVGGQYFAEGLADWRGTLLQLTWQSGAALVYNLDTFAFTRVFNYRGEGWGLTHDGTRLIMSDGTATLRFLDPATFKETRRVTVTEGGRPLPHLNELEFVKGRILANVWQTEDIVLIAPDTGRVVGRANCRGLLSPSDHRRPVDVFNGIAYDAQRDRLFVTGKLWPKLFEVRLEPR